MKERSLALSASTSLVTDRPPAQQSQASHALLLQLSPLQLKHSLKEQ